MVPGSNRSHPCMRSQRGQISTKARQSCQHREVVERYARNLLHTLHLWNLHSTQGNPCTLYVAHSWILISVHNTHTWALHTTPELCTLYTTHSWTLRKAHTRSNRPYEGNHTTDAAHNEIALDTPGLGPSLEKNGINLCCHQWLSLKFTFEDHGSNNWQELKKKKKKGYLCDVKGFFFITHNSPL